MATPITIGKLTNSKHLRATPPHYHHEHNVRISTSEQATSRKHQEPFTHPNLPLTAGMVVTTQSLENTNALPPPPRQQQHHHVEEPCLKCPTCRLPAMCHPNTPTKTHLCTGWAQTTPDTNQSPANVIPQINAACAQQHSMPNDSKIMSLPCRHRLPSSGVS